MKVRITIMFAFLGFMSYSIIKRNIIGVTGQKAKQRQLKVPKLSTDQLEKLTELDSAQYIVKDFNRQ